VKRGKKGARRGKASTWTKSRKKIGDWCNGGGTSWGERKKKAATNEWCMFAKRKKQQARLMRG